MDENLGHSRDRLENFVFHLVRQPMSLAHRQPAVDNNVKVNVEAESYLRARYRHRRCRGRGPSTHFSEFVTGIASLAISIGTTRDSPSCVNRPPRVSVTSGPRKEYIGGQHSRHVHIAKTPSNGGRRCQLQVDA